MDKHVSSLFCLDDRLLFITLIPDRNGGKCPFEDSITAERERGVSFWQAQIEWAICRTNWCLKSLQDLIGLKEGPGNGWCAYLRSLRPRMSSLLPLKQCCSSPEGGFDAKKNHLEKERKWTWRVNRLLCFKLEFQWHENHAEWICSRPSKAQPKHSDC